MRRLFFILIFSLLAAEVKSQYSELLIPQPQELVKLYKKKKVQMVKCFERSGPSISPTTGAESGQDVLKYIDAVDTSGYVLIRLEKFNKHYYEYDEKGRLINRLDSIKTKKVSLTNKYQA